MLRFSLSVLLLVVFYAAVCCAAMANPTDLWRQTVVTLVVLTLLANSVAVVVRSGSERCFLTGFSVAGWLYFALSFGMLLNVREDLLTERVLVVIGSVVHPDLEPILLPIDFSTGGRRLVSGSWDNTIRVWDVRSGRKWPDANKLRNFHDAGHAIWTLLVGCGGGVLGTWLRRKVGLSGPT